MTELIPYLLINCLAILGLHYVTREGMIGEGVSIWAVKTFGAFWSKPVSECPPCMASISGTLFYFTFINQGFVIWPVFVLALSGLTYIVNSKV